MNLEFKRGDKCPCGCSYFRAYEKTKHGLRPKFQSREVFLANKAADLRRQRLKRARAIAAARGLVIIAYDKDAYPVSGWPRLTDGNYMLWFPDGFFLRAEVRTSTVVFLYDRKPYSLTDITVGNCPEGLGKYGALLRWFVAAQGSIE